MCGEYESGYSLLKTEVERAKGDQFGSAQRNVLPQVPVVLMLMGKGPLGGS